MKYLQNPIKGTVERQARREVKAGQSPLGASYSLKTDTAVCSGVRQELG